jgi:hypothetical protein
MRNNAEVYHRDAEVGAESVGLQLTIDQAELLEQLRQLQERLESLGRADAIAELAVTALRSGLEDWHRALDVHYPQTRREAA